MQKVLHLPRSVIAVSDNLIYLFSMTTAPHSSEGATKEHGFTMTRVREPYVYEPLTPAHSELMSALHKELGSTAYRHYFQVNTAGETADVVRDGDRACALFVSRVLHRQSLLRCPHVRIASTLACMTASGWERDTAERVGDVVVWDDAASETQHMGIVVGNGLFVSNSSNRGRPVVHSENELPGRYFSHPAVVTNRDITHYSFAVSQWQV